MTPPLPAHIRRWLLLTVPFALAVLASGMFGRARPTLAAAPPPPPVDFNRHIRPILSEYCFACHGPDDKQRKAKLRLDTKDGAFGPLRSGGVAVVPGKLAQSELIARITSTDPDQVMPPPKSTKQLKAEQIDLLRRWIEQGAAWSEHWAFVAPVRSVLPPVTNKSWPHNPIDHFILARLEKRGMQPSPEADRPTLVRRVSLDLTGLPPTLAELDDALNDRAENWYEKVVDRLLQSPRYGEHMARSWLDAARYGDTHGLHLDNYREMWPYRDWVIKAFNTNLPFDRFLIEQLAGDLLPSVANANAPVANAPGSPGDLDQLIATGYNRCHVTTSEGGSIEEEVYVRNVVDQVETNGTVLFGLTFGCARCHDHKYDPFTMKDFYSLFAFFNSIDGKPLDGNAAQHPPVVRVSTPEHLVALDRLNQKVAGVQKRIADEVAKVPYDESKDPVEPESLERADYVWIDDGVPAGAKPVSDGGPPGTWPFVASPGHPVFSGRFAMRRSAEGQSQHYFTDANPGLHIGEGDTIFAHVYLDPANPPRELMLQWNAGDWKHRAYWGENLINFGADNTPERLRLGDLPETGGWVRLDVPVEKVGLKAGMTVSGWGFTQFGGTVYWDKAGIVTRTRQGDDKPTTLTAWLNTQRGAPGLPKPIQDILKVDAAKRNADQKQRLREHFIEHVYPPVRATFAPLHQELAAAVKERDQLDKQIPSTLVFKEAAQPRPAYILKRGEYDQKGEPVGRATPAFLPLFPENLPRNRLGLAQWLVLPSQPLTARVAVNRFWQQVFGTGIVRTAEDFGSQGEPPSHPELLDWLAIEFSQPAAPSGASGGSNAPGNSAWNVKQLIKLLVMSATYQQSARVTKDRLAMDPANRLLARGPRFRLDAETLRDQALFAGGLLVERVGGPSVKPPQPGGLWEAVGYTSSNTARFTADNGHEKVHRRSLYTFWKRTSHPPQMSTFDAPSREACQVRRERTNTPLQALLLLNETQFIEAARALAERTMKDGGTTVEKRLAYMFRLVVARPPDPKELAELVSAYSDHLAKYSGNPETAKKLINIGETKPDATLNPGELAAWTMIGNLILNLDEVINKG
ncbi:hypothetical protein AYO44_08625 [Planctomycetaceae bacterium SCGC AG-212-F19]|nr:hypothetical protein AYO44_08625 [Planctomycetaceae bacterium SCGC AG-212-F19]